MAPPSSLVPTTCPSGAKPIHVNQQSSYEHDHHETANIRLYPTTTFTAPTTSSASSSTAGKGDWSLNALVSVESSVILRSNSPLFTTAGLENRYNAAIPLSPEILELITSYPLDRLLIRVGDSASSDYVYAGSGANSNDSYHEKAKEQQEREERSMGPSGTSIIASFLVDSNHAVKIDGGAPADGQWKDYFRNQYSSLLRHLLDHHLFPSCGAPLDSLRVRKHGHSIVVHSPNLVQKYQKRETGISNKTEKASKTYVGEESEDFSQTSIGAKQVGASKSASTTQSIEVESVLSSDAASFCTSGIDPLLLSFRHSPSWGSGWGIFTNSPCHGSDNWGLFDSLFAPPVISSSASRPTGSSSTSTTPAKPLSTSAALSELLLRTSPDAAQWEHSLGSSYSENRDLTETGKEGKRNSFWIDLQVSPSCFFLSNLGDQLDNEDIVANECRVTVTRGANYHVALPRPSFSKKVSSDALFTSSTFQKHSNLTLEVSLGDMLLGRSTLHHVLENSYEGWTAWYPCPLSNVSKIILEIPCGYKGTIQNPNGNNKVINGVCSGNDTGGSTQAEADRIAAGSVKVELDVFDWRDGYIDLASPFLRVFRDVGKGGGPSSHPPTLPLSSFGISRTLKRPLGLSSGGTLISVLRHGLMSQPHTYGLESPYYQQSHNLSSTAIVQSLDTFPGTLLKLRMNSLSMILYHGGGAGGNRFVPPSESSCVPYSGPCRDSSSGPGEEQNRNKILCLPTYQCQSIQPLGQNNGHSDRAASQTPLLLTHLQLTNIPHSLTLSPDGTILLERSVALPPDSSLWMMVEYEDPFLPFQRFPADANRGIDVFSSRANFYLNTNVTYESPHEVNDSGSADTAGDYGGEKKSSFGSLTFVATLYSPSLLLLPPVPDMSMPFNVISLSCTLWAFMLGSLMNLLVRRGTEGIKREYTGEKKKTPLEKIKEKISIKGRKLKETVLVIKRKVVREKDKTISEAVNECANADEDKIN